MPFRLRHVCLALPLPLVTSGWLECQAEFGEAPGKGAKGPDLKQHVFFLRVEGNEHISNHSIYKCT